MTINPKKYPNLGHFYLLNSQTYDATSKTVRNEQAAFNRAPYLPVYDDGAGGDPNFETVNGVEGMVFNNDARLSCRSMLLGELSVFAVVKHTVTTGSETIALLGAGDGGVQNQFSLNFRNGEFRPRQPNGPVSTAGAIGGATGPQLVTSVIDADARTVGGALNGEAMQYSPQLDRPSTYAQMSPTLLIGDDSWSNSTSKFVGTIFAVFAGPVNLLSRAPSLYESLTLDIKQDFNIA